MTDAHVARRLAELADRELSDEEYAAARATPISDEERAEALDLVRWFTRRYPTPAESLAYVRRAWARWTAGRPRA